MGAGTGQPAAPALPVVFAATRTRPGGRFAYLTPRWPDARGYLVGLLEGHAAHAQAAGAGDVAELARAAARQVPTSPPAGAWRARVGECRYELGRQDLTPTAPGPGVPLGEWKSVKPAGAAVDRSGPVLRTAPLRSHPPATARP